MRRTLCPVLIGREEPRQELLELLAATRDGCGALVAITGEAGVGKSRLLREVVHEAGERDIPALLGRAVESTEPVPYRPLSEALFSHLRRSGPPDHAELRPYRHLIGRLVPEWADHVAPLEQVSTVALAEAVVRLLRMLGRERGCLVAFEDLHWADGETLEIVQYLADNLAAEPVLCVVTLRDDEASRASAMVRALAARRALVPMPLRRLDHDGVATMVRACLDADRVAPPLQSLLAATSDGLPFMVEEILATALDSGALRHDGTEWAISPTAPQPLPATFVEAVAGRLRRARASAEVLATAALLGGHFDPSVIAAVCAMPVAAVLDRLREAVDAQLLSVDAGGEGFRFRHALTRQAILATLLPPERHALAVRALAAVEARHPGLPGEWCEVAAALAAAAGETARAAELLHEVGRRALRQGALSTAERVLEHALALCGDGARLRTDIEDTLTEVLALAGDAQRLDEMGRRLLTGLRAVSASPGRIARVHLRLARAAIVAGRWTAAAAQLDEARGLGAAGGEVGVLTAQVALGDGADGRAEQLAVAALADAERERRPDLACEALEVLGRCARQRDLAAAEASFARAAALAAERGLLLWRVRALHELGTVDLLSGAGLDRLVQAREAAREAGALATAATVSLQMAAWHLNRMRLDDAVREARTCGAESDRLRLGVLQALGRVFEASAHAQRGARTEMERSLRTALELHGDDVEVRGVIQLQAWGTFWLVREDRARALAALDDGMALLRSTAVTAPMRGMWALLHALEDGDHRPVHEVEASGLAVYWLVRGWVGHARAVLLGRAGRPAEAEQAFARADADLGPCPWFRHHARRLVAEAAMADGWGRPADWLLEALDVVDAQRYPEIASACRSLLRRSGVLVPRRRRQTPGLSPELARTGITPRELEILQLLADALPTREVATRLHLSAKTVERHIANIAAKVGASGRAELIAFAARHAAELTAG